MDQIKQYIEQVSDFEQFKDVPRCHNCKHMTEERSVEGLIFKKFNTEYICTRGMPDLYSNAVIYNQGIKRARTQGYCGTDGKLFEARK